jgi:hypothetical protein
MGVKQMNKNDTFYIRQNTHIIPLYHTVSRKDLYNSWTSPKLLDKSFKIDFDDESIYYEFDSMKEIFFHLFDKQHEYLSENDRDVFEFSLLLTNKDRTFSDIPLLLYTKNQIISIHDITITLYGNGIGFLSYDIGNNGEFGDSAKNISAFLKKINNTSPIDLYPLIMPSEANKTFDFSQNDNRDELIASIYSHSHKFKNMQLFSFKEFIKKFLDDLFDLISSDDFAKYDFFDNYKCMHYLVLRKVGINKMDITNILPDFVPEYNTDKGPEEITHELFCYTDSNNMILFSDAPSFEERTPKSISIIMHNYFCRFIKYKTIQRVYTDVLQQYYFLKSLSPLYAFEKLPKDPQEYASNLSDELFDKIKELKIKINLFYLFNMTSFVSYKKSINDIYLYAKRECKINEISANLEKGVDVIAEMTQQVVEENSKKRFRKVERVLGVLAFLGICSVFADSLSFCEAFFKNNQEELPQILGYFNINMETIKETVPAQWIKLIGVIAAILILNITGLLELLIPDFIFKNLKILRNFLFNVPKYIGKFFFTIKSIYEEDRSWNWSTFFTLLFESIKKSIRKSIRRTYILTPVRFYLRLLLLAGVLLIFIVDYSGIINTFDEEIKSIIYIILNIYLIFVGIYIFIMTIKSIHS